MKCDRNQISTDVSQSGRSGKTTTSVISILTTALLSIIMSVYLLISKDSLLKQCNRLLKAYFPKKICEKVRYVLNIIIDTFSRYIVGLLGRASGRERVLRFV